MSMSMASKSDDVDVEQQVTTDSGDLGLGRGWKPGAIPKSRSEEDFKHVDRGKNVKLSSGETSVNNQPNQSLKKYPGGCTAEVLKTAFQVSTDNKTNIEINDATNSMDNGEEEFPMLNSIPFGTSLQQQTQIFQQNVHELFGVEQENTESPKQKKELSKKEVYEVMMDKKLLEEKLKQTHEEIDVLKQELEQSKLQLESKYRAISIMQNQASSTKTDVQNSTKIASVTNDQLNQEVNKLQFEMDYRQSHFSDSQELWTRRYAKLSEENSALQESLNARAEDVRRLVGENRVVVRERDELLALLDVQEKERYEAVKPCTEQQPYDGFTLAELAILGACQCRRKSTDPCQCAYAATNLKREVVDLKEQVVNREKQHKDCLLSMDAYRTAFEEQLSRNKNLVRQLAEMTATIMNNNSKTAKFKAAMKWLLQQLNEDLPPSYMNGDMQNFMTEQELEEKTEHELILLLVDMVSDKNEALAHQRLAARIMADKVKELEHKLRTHLGDDIPNV